VGGAEVAVLHPCHDEIGYDPGLSLNDNSIVLRLSLGSAAVLLAGDLGREGEQTALAEGAVRPADVLKLGHHGSSGSTGPQLLPGNNTAQGQLFCPVAGHEMPAAHILEAGPL